MKNLKALESMQSVLSLRMSRAVIEDSHTGYKKVDEAELEAIRAKNQKLEQENREMKARLDKIEKMLNLK